jgi:hypothetical protein
MRGACSIIGFSGFCMRRTLTKIAGFVTGKLHRLRGGAR